MPGSRTPRHHDGIAPVLALVGLGAFVIGLDATAVGAAVPSIGRDLGLGPGELSSVGVAALVPFAVLVPFGGSLVGRLDRTRALVAALLAFTVGTTCSAVAAGGTAVIVGRVVQGVAAAVLVPALLGLLRTRLDPPRRATGVTICWACVAAAAVLGPAVGGLLSELAGWRWVFLVNGPLLVAMLLLVPLATGPARVADHPRPCAGQVVPVVRIAQLLGVLGVSGVVYVTPLVHQERLGMGPAAAGLSVAIVSLGIVVAAPFGSIAVGRFGSRAAVAAGSVTVACGLLAVAAVDALPALGPRLPGLLLVGIGSALLVPRIPVVRDGATAARAGGAAGLVAATGALAAALGITVAGILLAAVEAPPSGGYTAVLIVGAGLQLAGAALAWVRLRPGPAASRPLRRSPTRTLRSVPGPTPLPVCAGRPRLRSG